MKVKYFAWVRERIGKAEETVVPPAEVRTVDDLIAWLSNRGESYAHAFERPKVIRAAIDHAHVRPDAVIAGARETAFFPPMTGGRARPRGTSPPPSPCTKPTSTSRTTTHPSASGAAKSATLRASRAMT